MKDLKFLAAQTDEVDVAAGRELIRQGVSSDSFFLVLDGEVEIDIEGTPRAVLRQGDFFGEISMLDRGPATATAVVRTPGRMMVMSHTQFRDAIKAKEGLLSQVLAAMAARLRANES